MPVSSLTPGAFVTQDLREICHRGYSASVRPFGGEWTALKMEVYARYDGYNVSHGMAPYPTRGYAIDHLVPLEIGGAPRDVRNMWPQPVAEAIEKDRVEDALHVLVCDGEIGIADAQDRIARDWRTAVPPTAHFSAEELRWLNRDRSYDDGD
jgi:hypothetical protein